MDQGTLKVTGWVKSKRTVLKARLSISIHPATRMRAEQGSTVLKTFFHLLLNHLICGLWIKHAAHQPFRSVPERLDRPCLNVSASCSGYKFRCKYVSKQKPNLHHQHLFSVPHSGANITCENETRQSYPSLTKSFRSPGTC